MRYFEKCGKEVEPSSSSTMCAKCVAPVEPTGSEIDSKSSGCTIAVLVFVGLLLILAIAAGRTMSCLTFPGCG